MGVVGVEGYLALAVDVGLQLGQLCRRGGILQQVDAVKGGQRLRIRLALQHRHAALVIGEVAGLAEPT